MPVQFYKYHALGNDYIVMPAARTATPPKRETIRLLCHRHFGLGSDGILWGALAPETPEFAALADEAAAAEAHTITDSDCVCGLRIFNPDGSEAEKSGNGLRIFSRYLYDTGAVASGRFRLLTLGGVVTCEVLEDGREVRVDMGQVSFDAARVPVTGVTGEVIECPIEVDGIEYLFNAATIGNPHCVIVCDDVSKELVCRIGPPLEVHSRFPNRTNVQILSVRDRRNLQIEIWERGAGYTLASGSSASACAAVAHRLGLCDESVTVHMPGGTLAIEIAEDYRIRMQGKVTGVARGEFLPEVSGRKM